VDLDDNNGIVVDITANITDRLLQQLRSAGALVLYSNVDFHAIRAIVPPGQIEGIAASSDVAFIDRKAEMITAHAPVFKHLSGSKALPKASLPLGFELRAARIRKQLAALLQATNGTGQGAVTRKAMRPTEPLMLAVHSVSLGRPEDRRSVGQRQCYRRGHRSPGFR